MQLKILFKKFFKLWFYLPILAGFFFLFYCLNSIFIIKTIVVKDEKKDIKNLTVFKNRNIFFISENEIKDLLLLSNPTIENLEVSKIYPDKLEIGINYYSLLGCLKVDGGYFILGENGKILDKKRDECLNLPIITYYQKFNFSSYKSGQSLDIQDIKTSLFFLQKISEIGAYINSIDINGFDMLVFNLKDKKVYFTAGKDRDRQIYEFESIFTEFKREGRQIKSIDLRFEKPVIKL